MKSVQTFYSRKNIFVTVGTTVGIYVLLNIGTYIVDHRPIHQDKPKDPLVGLNDRQKSSKRAEKYLADSILQVKPSQRFILDYLHRKFNLNETLGAAKTPIDIPENPASYPEEVHFLTRIAYPSKVVNQKPKGVIGDAATMSIYAANCDHIVFPTNYWQIVQKNVAAGGYMMAHVEIALAFIKDNQCTLPPNANDIREQVLDGLVKIINNPATVSDLRYEAIAFLQLAGKNDLVKPEWIDKIISEQHEDGGWGLSTDDKNSNDHATTLALWALLEYDQPNKPYEPIIRRANAGN